MQASFQTVDLLLDSAGYVLATNCCEHEAKDRSEIAIKLIDLARAQVADLEHELEPDLRALRIA